MANQHLPQEGKESLSQEDFFVKHCGVSSVNLFCLWKNTNFSQWFYLAGVLFQECLKNSNKGSLTEGFLWISSLPALETRGTIMQYHHRRLRIEIGKTYTTGRFDGGDVDWSFRVIFWIVKRSPGLNQENVSGLNCLVTFIPRPSVWATSQNHEDLSGPQQWGTKLIMFLNKQAIPGKVTLCLL